MQTRYCRYPGLTDRVSDRLSDDYEIVQNKKSNQILEDKSTVCQQMTCRVLVAEKGVGPIIDRSRVSSNTKWKGVQINANTLRFETSEHSEAFHLSFIWATWSPHACLMVICSV